MFPSDEQNIDEGTNNLSRIYSNLEKRSSVDERRSIQSVSSSTNISDHHRTSIDEKNKFRSFRKSYSVDQGFVESTPEYQVLSEEKINDGIIEIYLKRTANPVANRNSHSFDGNEAMVSLKNSQLRMTTTKFKRLKAGTLEKIVEFLTDEFGNLDRQHMNVLFSTYRRYTKTEKLIDELLKRFRSVQPATIEITEDVRLHMLESLKQALQFFLTNYREDFDQPPDYSLLRMLIENCHDEDLKRFCQKLTEDFRCQREISSSIQSNNEPMSLDLLAIQPKSTKYLLELSTTIVAEQLTLGDAVLLKAVLPHECLSVRTHGNQRGHDGSELKLSTVEKTIEYFNSVVNCVTTTILDEEDNQVRARLIEKWIEIADKCRTWNNFSSSKAILNALLSGSIFRLKLTWSHVTLEHRSLLDQLNSLLSNCEDQTRLRNILEQILNEIRQVFLPHTRSSIKYADVVDEIFQRKSRHTLMSRHKTQKINGTIPYLGLYLSDLTMLDSAYGNHLTIDSKTLIHFGKHRKIFEILAQIHLFKLTLGAFDKLKSNADFNRWFESIRTYSDKENWKRSEKLEVPEVSSASVAVPYVDSNDSFDTRSNGSSSSRSQQTSLTTVSSCEDESERLNVFVFFPGRNQGKGKQIRIGTNDRVASVLKIVLLEFDLDPVHHNLYSIEQKLPGRNLNLSDNCNVFYALRPLPNNEQIQLIVRKKFSSELNLQSKQKAKHHREPSEFSISSSHSR